MWLTFALRNIFHNRYQFGGTLFAIALCVFLFMMLKAFSAGSLDSFKNVTIRSRTGHGAIFAKGYYGNNFENPFNHWITSGDKAIEQIKNLTNAEFLFPRVTFSGMAYAKSKSAAVETTGMLLEAEREFFQDRQMLQGVHAKSSYEVILGEGLAERLGSAPGSTITLLTSTVDGTQNSIDLVVTGIFKSGNRNHDFGAMYIDIQTAQTLLDTAKLEMILYSFRNLHDTLRGFEQSALAQTLEDIPLEELDRLYYQNSVIWLKEQLDLATAIVVLAAVLSSLGMINFALRCRASEFGILKTHGESHAKLLSYLAREGGLLAACGWAIGTLCFLTVAVLSKEHGFKLPPAPGTTRSYLVFVTFSTLGAAESLCLALGSTWACYFISFFNISRQSTIKLLNGVSS